MAGRTLQFSVLFLVLGLALAEGCGQGDGMSACCSTSAADAPKPAAVAAKPQPALAAPELADVRSALEAGRAPLALELLEGQEGLEVACLRARAELLSGLAVEALAELEKARVLAPEHPEVFGTEVELLAQLDRLQGASELLEQALRRCGSGPALLRARGAIELRVQGHGAQALEAYERARAADPAIPFVAWPMAQAHLLVGRAKLERSPAESVVHARAAVLLEPDLLDARELEAEALAADLRYEEALAVYAELEERGRMYGETPALLHQKCATRWLLQRDRGRAVEHYLAARALGLDDEALGFGADLLKTECDAAMQRGRDACEREEWATAEREFARAVELAPDDLACAEELGFARFAREDYRGAAEAWAGLLARAQARSTGLDSPVPLDLARAWRLAGEPERARAVLSELLDRDPAGPLGDGARELLAALEAEALAPR